MEDSSMKTIQVKPLKSKGSVTLPAEAGHEDKVVELARRWGADAIRDSDGTSLSKEILALGHEVYSTICLVRAEQEWPRKHKDQIPEKYLMSKPVTAMSQKLEIQILASYHPEKYLVDAKNSPKKYCGIWGRTPTINCGE